MNLRHFHSLTMLFAIMLFTGCEHERESTQKANITGNLTWQSACRSNQPDRGTGEIPDSLSCVNYVYNAAIKKLTLHHFNAGFNCCPGVLSCKASSSNDVIVITESEEYHLCNCNCLYDLTIEVTGVENRKYRIIFSEPYSGSQEPLAFDADLPASSEGSFCVTRTGYPWGT